MQQRIDISAFAPGSGIGKARQQAATAPQCVELFQGGLGHGSTISGHATRAGRITVFPRSVATDLSLRKPTGLHPLDFPVRAGLIDNARQVVGKHFERFIGRDAEMLGDLLDLIATERRPDLFRGHLHIGTVTQPGFDLLTQSSLLQLIDKALQAAKICLGQQSRQ
ncbi:MAG TPA: hypothetical protein VEI95_07580, partial [Acidobacteriota bacterium]|nr:hypothetical protein [Acidobacteriota bacterium]